MKDSGSWVESSGPSEGSSGPSVRRLWPAPVEEVDGLTCYDDSRDAPEDRPYVLLNMVASVDGATAVHGVSGALGSATDRAILRHLRALADAVVVGAGTARAERYGPVRLDEAAMAARVGRGQAARPPVVVVTRSAALDWHSSLFEGSEPRPILVVPDAVAGEVHARAVSEGRDADVVACGEQSVDLSCALRLLRARGLSIVLCEGGPRLNAQLLAAGLVDEVCLTLSPLLAGGDHPRGILAPISSDGAPPVPVMLAHVLEAEGFLYLRYVVGSASRHSGARVLFECGES